MNKTSISLQFAGLVLFSAQASGVTFTVTTNADAGPGSLREAITLANASPGHDFIHFAILPSNQVQVISLAAGLPPVTDPVTIARSGTTSFPATAARASRFSSPPMERSGPIASARTQPA